MANNVQYILSLKDQFSAGIDRANASVKGLEGSMLGLRGMLASTFSVVGIGMFVKSVIQAGTTVEDARVGLTTLLKDANAANKVISNTMEDAVKTPFSFENLLNANRALISAGVNADVARKDVLNLGNAIAASGKGNAEFERMVVNLQQIKNTGEATALDLKQFAYAGINLAKVLEAAGIKIAKGQNGTYEQITYALQKAHEAGGMFYNGLENMANNTSVKISNLGDAVQQLSAKMFDDLKPAIEWVVTGLFKLIDKLRSGWEWIVKNKNVVKQFAMGMSELFVVVRIGIPLMQGLGMSFTAMLGPIGLLATGVLAVVTALNLMNAAYDDRRAQEQADRIDERNRVVDGYSTIYEEKFKKSGLSRAAFLKKEREDLAQADKEYNAQAEKSIREGTAMDNQRLGYLARKKAGLELFGNKGLTAAAKSGGEVAKKGKDRAETKAVGSKSVTINVHNDSIIKAFTIQTTNIKEGADKLKEMVVNALASALNDFQVVAE